MAYIENEKCEGSSDSAEQREINALKYEIRKTQESIKHNQALLRIARAKLAAVKALVK